jgi:AP-3 complex subunit beta
MARERPLMFRTWLSDFFVKSTDPMFNRLLKLEILTSLCHKDNIQSILKELQIYVKDSNKTFVCATVKAIGRVADADPNVSPICSEGVMHLMLCCGGIDGIKTKHNDPETKRTDTQNVQSECVVVLRQLLQQNPSSTESSKILKQLVKLLLIEDGISHATARSSIVWLVGEFHELIADVAPDILRILTSGFVEENTETKTQILNLAVKQSVLLPEDESVQSLMTYTLEMARYDADTDLRDR